MCRVDARVPSNKKTLVRKNSVCKVCLSGGRVIAVVSPGEPELLVLDSADGLDLRGLAVGTPVSPVLIVSAVPLTLHDVLPSPVSRELVTHKTTHMMEK